MTQNIISQEQIYQLIYNKKWSDIIDVLHKNKDKINKEPIFLHAAQTFESVFLQTIDQYQLDDRNIKYVLERLLLLHHGAFYLLSENSKKLISIELVKRCPLSEAYNYAKQYPESEICQDIIRQFEQSNINSTNLVRHETVVSHNWIEIYNRLFEAINHQDDAATYFSGPRFINAVREILPYHPDYNQYIQLRNQEGKSTTRKIFYFDILMGEDETTRIRIVDNITTILKPFVPEKIKAIEMLLGRKKIDSDVINTTEVKAEPNGVPVVFISYSWDHEEHKKWVLNLADRLSQDGVKVILDRYYLRPGANLQHFVEQSISNAHKIIIVFTPNYKLKADKRTGGVGYEYSIMNADLYQQQTKNEKVIPILRAGDSINSIPTFMRQFIHIDLTKDDKFENSYMDLVREIYNEPAIKTPQVGSKPQFD